MNKALILLTSTCALAGGLALAMPSAATTAAVAVTRPAAQGAYTAFPGFTSIAASSLPSAHPVLARAAAALPRVTLSPAGGVAGPGSAGVWHSPEPVPGLAALNAGRDAQMNVVSCSAPGECAGGGFYTDRAGHTQAFVVDERKGVWGAAREVPGSAALNTGGAIAVNAISCASPGRCAIGGSYNGGAAAWVADEAGGVWGHAQELAGALNDGGVAAVTSISCVRPGYCAAGGTVGVAVDSGENAVLGGFVASEARGTWTAFGVAQAATVSSISCGSAGNCVAGGAAEFAPGDYIVTETSGTWGSSQPLPGTGTLSGISPRVTSVSCEPSGCDAVGTTAYCIPVSCTTQTPSGNGVGFGVTETGGTWGSAWGNAVALPLPVPAPSAHRLAGAPVTVMHLAGRVHGDRRLRDRTIARGNIAHEGVTIGEANGKWSAPRTVPSLVSLDTGKISLIPSVACPAPGDCAAVALYRNHSGTHAAVLPETRGRWGTAQPLPGTPGQTVSQAISCGAAAHCSIGGGYAADGKHYQAIVADETPALSTTTTESRSARSVVYGREQAEKVSVTVLSARGPAPGKVTVTSAGTRACTITLARGKGSCTIPARKFSSGPHALTATYGGAPGFAASSAARLFWVDRAKSKTTLTLSAATASYGHEQAAKLTVGVIPRYTGTPGGKVAIMAGRVRVCLITLKRATGSCRLGARTLRPGTYQMIAAYAGNQDFRPSASPSRSLTITR